LKLEELTDKLEEAYVEAEPGTFPSVDIAVEIVASALKWLTSQCEDKDDKESS